MGSVSSNYILFLHKLHSQVEHRNHMILEEHHNDSIYHLKTIMI